MKGRANCKHLKTIRIVEADSPVLFPKLFVPYGINLLSGNVSTTVLLMQKEKKLWK